MGDESQHGPGSTLSRAERRRARKEVRAAAAARKAELEARAEAALRDLGEPDGARAQAAQSADAGRPQAPGWARDNVAAALPLTAAALPTADGTYVLPTDPDGLRRLRKAFEADVAAASAAAAGQADRGRKTALARQRSLSRMVAEQGRRAKAADERRRRSRERARNVYDAIGFDVMLPNGVAQVEEGVFSETLEFTDMCYQSARDDEQRGVFDKLQDVANSFGAGSSFQYLLTNIPLDKEEIGRRAFFDEAAAGDNADLARIFNEVLNERVREGSNNLRSSRYLSYSVEAPDPVDASAKLARLRGAVQVGLQGVGSQVRRLDGLERLDLVNSLLRPGRTLDFDYSHLSGKSGLTAKDAVCPQEMDFLPTGGMRSTTRFTVDGRTWCQVLVMRPSFAARLDDKGVGDLIDLRMPIAVTWHGRQIDRAEAISMLMQRDDWLQSEIMAQQSYAINHGYSYEMIPRRLEDQKSANDDLLDALMDGEGSSDRPQNLFYFTGLVYTWADSPKELDQRAMQIVAAAHARGIELDELADRQQEGINSVLPLAFNRVDVQRDFTTHEITQFMPFVTQRLDMPGGTYYGVEPTTGDMILVNRSALLSPHGIICGMTGSGKSFAVKREIEQTILAYGGDQVYILDPTGEYGVLAVENRGTHWVKMGPDADLSVNILDMGDLSASRLSWQQAKAWKVDAMLAATAALRNEGGRTLTQEERSVVSRCVEEAYERAGGEGGPAPTLRDFWEALRRQPEPEASGLALVFERYVSGSLSFMARPTNIEHGARIVSFDTSEVPSDMRVFAMLANLESVRAAMYRNHAAGRRTWLYIDEFQTLFAHDAVVSYLARLWREGRKFGLICTGMMQSAAAMDEHNQDARTIVDQSGFLVLLRQSDTDRDFWERRKGLSEVELGAIGENAVPGSGLLIADGARVAFKDEWPRGNRLWDIFNTSPEEAEAKFRRIREGRAVA